MLDDVIGQQSGEDRIEELERTLASLREDSEVAYVLLGLSGALGEVRSTDETLGLAVRTVPELFGASRCFAAVWEDSLSTFKILASSGYSPDEVVGLHELTERGESAFPLLSRARDERGPVFVSDEEPVTGGAAIVIPLSRWGEDFGALRLEFSSPREFGSKDAALARGVARQVGVALNNARRFSLLKNLRSFGFEIGGKLKTGELIDQILRGSIELLAAEGAWIYFLDPDQNILVSGGGNGDGISLPERLARLSLDDRAWAELAVGATVVERGLGPVFGGGAELTVVATPLSCASNPMMGALLVAFERSREPGAEELEAFSVLGGQAAQALENARRFQRERSVARKLQTALLGTENPTMDGFEWGAVYEPADGEAEVGGDFYDLIDVGDGRFGVVVGDVSGKGAEAAAQTATVKYMLRAYATRNPSPASVLFHLNNALYKELQDDRFTTVVYALFDPAAGKGWVSLAGHPAPLVYRAGTSEVITITAPGMVLGVVEEQNFEATEFDLEDGDVFVAFSDGLLEARSGDELYGPDRIATSLAAAARAGSPEDIARALYKEARNFGQVADDTVVLALVNKNGG